MVSSEFKATVEDKNLLLTKIMLKDSFVLDPTFAQLREMLSYAQERLPDLMETYNGDYLEEDSSKWTSDTMNEELVELITNFSIVRINHLKKVVSKVLAKEAEAIKRKQLAQNAQNNRVAQSPLSSRNRTFSNDVSREVKRKEALRNLSAAAKKVNKVIYEVDKINNGWKQQNINDLEQAAEGILRAVSEYRANRSGG